MSESQFVVEPIALESFESLVIQRRHEDAIRFLIDTLTAIKRGAGFNFYALECPPVETIYTRLASAITQLFTDPNFGFTHDGFVRLCGDHPTLHGIFKASSFHSMDHVLSLVGARDPADQSRLSFTGEQSIPKLLLCWSLDSTIDLDYEAISAGAPTWFVAAMLGWLSIGGIHSQKGYDRKCELLRKAHLLEVSPFHDASMMAAGDCYMHCSYVDIPEKHEVKKVLNRQLRRLIESKMTVEERPTLERKERPKIVVPIEWFGSHHAMYRCYAPSLLQLRPHFEVVAIARTSEIDDASKQVFDKVIELSADALSVADIVAAVAAEAPDIIYYPSIGMTAWWVALSNFRLAPIQAMTPGHPATTHSDCIDYIVSDGDLFGDERMYREKCVPLPVGGARYIGRGMTEFPGRPNGNPYAGSVPGWPPLVRLAVPAMVMKLVPPFLAACQRIRQESKVPVEFHFFPNMQATGYVLITNELRKWVPDCVVHPRMDYGPYLELLAQCDLMLSTFPFGGTNSSIDAMLVGLPVLTLEGNQIHERSDASMIRRAGLPQWLIVKDADAYVQMALHFAECGWDHYGPSAAEVQEEFYGDGPKEVHGAFLAAFQNIYRRELERGQASTFSKGSGRNAGDRPGDVRFGVRT